MSTSDTRGRDQDSPIKLRIPLSTWPSASQSMKERKEGGKGTSLVVQWLRGQASSAGGVGLIPGWGTRIMHAQCCSPQNKIKQQYGWGGNFLKKEGEKKKKGGKRTEEGRKRAGGRVTTEVLVKDKSEEAAVGSIGSLSWKERCFPGRTVTTGPIR